MRQDLDPIAIGKRHFSRETNNPCNNPHNVINVTHHNPVLEYSPVQNNCDWHPDTHPATSGYGPSGPSSGEPNGKLISRRQRDPDKFSGESTEWLDYFRHFEIVATWNGWGEHEKTMQLAMCLQGEAQRVLGDLSPDILADYDSLVRELTRRFNP